ncbi:MAG: hypothetical protein A2521_14385 [Deltaproteobacteria bacterium RIFOXYD12_FULL_57_12]|nr:MAG: hypothetical protein A2521_14385 [Deltaproteobacteria bacterium RIFOXYD12_FULL_57_12]
MGFLQQRGTFNQAELLVARELLDDALTKPESDYHILCAADTADTVVGYICFGAIPMTDHRYDLYWIAVDPGCGRQGIGGLLLRHMEDAITAHGGGRIYIDTSSTPPYEAARAFYQAHGFRVAAVLHDFYRQGDDKVIFMKEVVTALGG